MNILEFIDDCMEQGMTEEQAGLMADEAFILGEKWDRYNGFAWDREEDYCDTYDGDATRDD